MLRSSGGGSHVIQANAPPFGVTLAGHFATPVSCGALAASPQSGTASEVLPTSSVRVRTRTGRIRSMEPPPTAPFKVRLSVSSIRLTRRSAAESVVAALYPVRVQQATQVPSDLEESLGYPQRL